MKKIIIIGLLLISSVLMAETANVVVKLKAVSAITINASTHPTIGEASPGNPGADVLDFGTYIVRDHANLEADSTIYLDNLDLSHNALSINVPDTINIENMSSPNTLVTVHLELDKNELQSGDVKGNSATVNLHGTIGTTDNAITFGNYIGTVPVTVTYN